MIDAAKAGFRTNGMVATGFTEVIANSGAARGAIYHHFPGGKEELAAAVVGSTADNVEGALHLLFSGNESPIDALIAGVDLLADAFDERLGFGCAIAPAVLEAAGSTTIVDAAAAAFDRWQRVIREALAAAPAHSVRQPSSGDAASLIVASLEGALILSRAARSSQPIRAVGHAVAALLRPT
jgi:AcrR family transcriptional regulator